MKTAAAFLDALQARFGVSSDRQLERYTGWKPAQTSRYRVGKNTFDDATCIKVAAWLEIDPGYVMMCMAAQRAATPAIRDAWESMLKKTAACILLGFGALLGGEPMQAAAAPASHNENYTPPAAPVTSQIHIMRTIRRWISRLLHFPRAAFA